MSTSAQDRLDALFRGKQLPRRPQPDETSLHESEVKIASSNEVLNVEDPHENDMRFAALKNDPTTTTSRSTEHPVEDGSQTCDSVATHSQPNVKTMLPIEMVAEGKKSIKFHFNMDDADIFDVGQITEHDASGNKLQSQFCPFTLVLKFPYKYLNDPDNRVSRQFFSADKIYNRSWKLHYIHAPTSFGIGQILLVPLTQVLQLLNDIEQTFSLKVTLPKFPFTVPFYDDGTPQPVYVGTFTSKDEYVTLQTQIPEAAVGNGECPPKASEELRKAFAIYHAKYETLHATGRKSKAGSKKKGGKGTNFVFLVQEQRDQLKRAERYFGLWPKAKLVEKAKPSSSWEEEQVWLKAQRTATSVSFLSIEEASKYPFDGEPVIISVDVESFERDHSLITEIGISTLDTLDLIGVAPGAHGQNWTKQIRSRHFRINGRQHLNNKDFVAGCPDSFVFGQSEFISLSEVADTIDSCFEWPFAVQYKHVGGMTMNDPPEGVDNIRQLSSSDQKGPKHRNIVLLGHDTGADISYLGQIGSRIFGPYQPPRTSSSSHDEKSISPPKANRQLILATILEALDTAKLYQAWKLEPQTKSLASIANALGIETWYLHNAGNDARYTMECLVRLVIAARLQEDESARSKDPTSSSHVQDYWTIERQVQLDTNMSKRRQDIEKSLIENHHYRSISSDKSTDHVDSMSNKPMPVSEESSTLSESGVTVNEEPQEKNDSMEERIRRFNEAYGHFSQTRSRPATAQELADMDWGEPEPMTGLGFESTTRPDGDSLTTNAASRVHQGGDQDDDNSDDEYPY